MTAVIEVCKDKRHILPLEKFVNGRVDQSQTKELTCKLLGRTETTKLQEKNQRIMVAESPHMTYIGKNFGQTKLQHSQNLMKHYVGVYDKKKGKMKVYDTEMFNMLPHIPAEEKDDTAKTPEKTYKEKSDMLTSAFGSSRRKRALDTRNRQAVNEEQLEGIMKTTMEKGIEDVQQYQTKRVERPVTDEMSTIPPYNMAATSPEQAYSISDILSDRDMNDLHNSAKVFYDTTQSQILEWTKEEKFPTHILKQLTVMPISEEARWQRAKCLLYMTYLIQFFRLSHRDLGKQSALPETCPMSIRKKILNNFTITVDQGGRTKRLRPDRMKDRLVSYILVLALIIDDFSLAPMDLQKDLKQGKTKMVHYLRGLGCLASNSKDASSFDYLATLKIPLTFPKARVKKSR